MILATRITFLLLLYFLLLLSLTIFHITILVTDAIIPFLTATIIMIPVAILLLLVLILSSLLLLLLLFIFPIFLTFLCFLLLCIASSDVFPFLFFWLLRFMSYAILVPCSYLYNFLF